jgi:hypothetical protein
MFKKAGILAALLLAATLLLIAGGKVDAQAENSPVVAPERAYLCFQGATANEVMKKANEAGARGWRLVAAAPGNQNSIWCFEHFGTSRPAEVSP